MAILGPYGFQETHSDDWVGMLYSLCTEGPFMDADTSMGLPAHSLNKEPPLSMASAQSLSLTA